jgi:hypothetical protein
MNPKLRINAVAVVPRSAGIHPCLTGGCVVEMRAVSGKDMLLGPYPEARARLIADALNRLTGGELSAAQVEAKVPVAA